ncbi:MAG: BACON domain-containing carbohydrate-binding protein [Phycisphaerae bacterium]
MGTRKIGYGVMLVSLSIILAHTAVSQATPDYLIFGADYNYSGVVNANESITGSTELRPEGSGGGDSQGTITQVTGGKYGGGMLVAAMGNDQRTRYSLPSGYDAYNGMVEVWFKTSNADDKLTLLVVGEDNLVRWDPSTGNLTAYLGSAGMTWYAGNIADGNWHHVALSWGDSANWKKGKRLWFDGANVAWSDTNYSVMNPATYLGTQEGNAAGGNGDVYFDELHLYGPGWQNLVYNLGGAPGYFGEVGPLAEALPGTTPVGMVFGADYNSAGIINANTSSTASKNVRAPGSGPEDSYGLSFQLADGKWGGGMKVLPDQSNSRVRYDVPSGFSSDNGMVEVWFKMTGTNNSDTNLIDLGGGNFLRWEVSSGDLVAAMGAAVVRYNVGRIDDNTWHHAAISWGAGGTWKRGKRLWFDGANRNWNDGDFTPLSGVTHIGIGAPGYGGGDTAIIYDELHVYDVRYNDLVYLAPSQGEPGYSATIGPLFPALATPTTVYTINTAGGTSFSPGVRGHHPECVGVHRGEYLRGIPKVLAVSDGTFLRGLAAGMKAETYDWRNRFEYGVPANGLGQPTIDFLRYQRDRNSTMINTVNTRGLTRQSGTTCEYYDTNITTLTNLAADWVRYTNHIVPTYRLGNTITDPRDAGILNSLSWKTEGDTADQFEPLLFAQESAVPKVMYWEIGNEPSSNLSATNSYVLTPAQYRARYQAITAAMKAEDTTIKVGPSDVTAGTYIDEVVSDSSLPVDIVYYHATFSGDLGSLTDSSQIQNFLNNIYSGQQSLKNGITSIISASGRDPATIPLAITEWNPNYSLADTPSVGRMSHALGCMETVFSFARLGIFDANYLKYPADCRDGMEYPVYKAWQALNDHMGDVLVDVHTETDFRMYTTKNSATGQVAVWGLNFSDANDKTMQITLDQLPQGVTNATWMRLGALSGTSTLLSGNISWYDGGPQVDVDWRTWDVSGISTSSLTFQVPRASMCVLVVGTSSLKVSPQTQTVFWPATSFAVTVGNTGGGALSWTAQVISGTDWLSINVASGTDHGTILVTAAQNSSAARTGIIRVTSGSVSKDVTVVQGGPVTIPGDVNGDGVVNADDLSIVLTNMDSKPPTDARADLDQDGEVTSSDLAIVLANMP